MKYLIKPMVLALALSGGLVLVGCSSSPSDEEMANLAALKKEVASLQGKVDEANRDKASLEKQIAEKNGKLQQCQSDQETVKKALGKPGMDERLEIIFARGIDPESETAAVARGNPAWPSRDAVREYADAADQLVLEAIDTADLDRAGHPPLNRAQALWTILEHEEMHQETLAYIWHQLPHDRKRSPAGYSAVDSRSVRADLSRRVHIPTGLATLGTNLHLEPFAWDNEQNEHPVVVPAFTIDAFNVTNGQFLEFVRDGGYGAPRWWRPEDWAWVIAEHVEHPHFWNRRDNGWSYRGMFEQGRDGAAPPTRGRDCSRPLAASQRCRTRRRER